MNQLSKQVIVQIQIKEKITCECGYELNKNNMTRHRKTKKHIKLMESNTTL